MINEHINKNLINLCTSKIKETWSPNNLNFLLGEWCTEYADKAIDKYKYKIAKPFCTNQKLKDFHYKKAREIEESFFRYLVDNLNEIHNKKFSDRFWKIILGHWVRRYVSIIYNRVNILEENIDNKLNYTFIALRSKDYSMNTKNSSELVWLANDDVWNNLLHKKILSFF